MSEYWNEHGVRQHKIDRMCADVVMIVSHFLYENPMLTNLELRALEQEVCATVGLVTGNARIVKGLEAKRMERLRAANG